MEKKTQGAIFVAVLVIYSLLWRVLSRAVPSDISVLLWIVWAVIVLFFFYWLVKAGFFKKMPIKERPEHRLQVAEELGLVSAAIWVGYILGLFSIGLGVSFLFLDRPDKFDAFLGTTILGLIVIFIMFFVNRSRKK
jgi:hypothetical protein